MDMVYTLPPSLEARAKEVWSFGELSGVAAEALHAAAAPYGPKVKLGMVSGPISTGGFGRVEANLGAFEETVALLERLGVPLFNQLPFEPHLWRIARREGSDYNPRELLEGFYLPLLMSGRIGTLYFIHGWEGSNGARWEHGKAIELGLGRVFLPQNFHRLPFRFEPST